MDVVFVAPLAYEQEIYADLRERGGHRNHRRFRRAGENCSAMNRTFDRTSRELALNVRQHILRMLHRAQSSHVGSCLSCTDLLAVLYASILRIEPLDPQWAGRDRFVLSKGHAAAALYATLAETGFFPCRWLDEYGMKGSALLGHTNHHVPGVEVSTGSLGHGLPIGCGMALGAMHDGQAYRVFVMLSDGELDEGSNWEAILFAGHHKLDNLVAIVDYNKIQGLGPVQDVLALEPMVEKWRAFGWAVREVDGHDCAELCTAFENIPIEAGKPSVFIAHTVKGKGVSFMENKLLWHYRSPNDDDLARALVEVGA